MTGVSFASQQVRNTDFIRKSLDADVFFAPLTVTPPLHLTTGASSDLQALPAGYVDVGFMEKNQGVDLARAIGTTPTMSVGQLSPTRNDINKNEVTARFIMQETKRQTLELYHQVALGGVILDPTTKELDFTEQIRPTTINYRMLVLWTDNNGTDSIYVGIDLPRVSVSSVGNIKITDGVDAITRDVTITSYVDAALGYGVRWLYGGPGWAARAPLMQFS